MAEPELYTVREAARILSISRTAVYTLIARGELTTAYPIGRALRITRDSLRALVDRTASAKHG
jgi:excisionase family DNA binding protein